MYTPSSEILEKYANVLVNFALGGGVGIKPKESVLLQVPECAKPMLLALHKVVVLAGGYPIVELIPNENVLRGTMELSKDFINNASDDQLLFFPEKYMRGKVDQADHLLAMLSENNKQELDGVDPKKIMMRQKAYGPYKDWRFEKENQGKMTWTLALYGTQAMADEAKMSLEEYWEQIIKACYLDEVDPVVKWKQVFAQVESTRQKLSDMKIQKLHVKSESTDLIVGVGSNRKWLGGSGRNIPSFEIFVSPDCRVTSGHVYLDQPLYRYGTLITGIKLEFKDGVVVSASANSGENYLKEMLAVENANKIGEFSLTDGRLSRITKFMAETLFDENVGGPNGNFHIALGMAYKDAFAGDMKSVTKAQWKEMGFNDSSIHTDVISTENRTVTATLEDGSDVVIYKDGMFVI